MSSVDQLKAALNTTVEATKSGPPARTINQFFGVGPITDMTSDEVDSRRMRVEFENWLEKTYRKLDDKGNDLGPFTAAEIGRSMHRGYPADAILLDMMGEIHGYFGFPKSNKLAVGLGGGHSGFTVAIMHMMDANNPDQHVFVDTPAPETEAGKAGGFFRQSWGTQIIEMQRFAENGDESRIHFTGAEGTIPSADELGAMGVKLFVGVGHETTGATTYTEGDVTNLLAWIDMDPANHHAIIDATSMLGAMPWSQKCVTAFTQKTSMFMPFQKAVGGISGYFTISLTPAAFDLIEGIQANPAWAIPRQLKMVVPVDTKMPLSGKKTIALGPIYDPAKHAMMGGIINTYSTLAFAETTYGLRRTATMVGDVTAMNARSIANRDEVNAWVENQDLLELGVTDKDRRGAAVTLLRVKDPGITDADIHNRIIARSKQLLGYEGLIHPNGDREPGLDVARYVNAFPGTPGDYRAWIGGIRPVADITALLENLAYAYQRAKIVVLEEELAALGEPVAAAASATGTRTRVDDPARVYKVLVADLVGLKFDADGNPDCSAVKTHAESLGAHWHDHSASEASELAAGIHFFYQPSLSTHDELMAEAGDGQYDAAIAAATAYPVDTKFPLGGVRIGAGTGNMGSASWGGGNGNGGDAPLMNTPSFNSRATAHMAIKGLLKVAPDLDMARLHERVCAGDFDTGKNLCEYPTEKLEGKTMAVLGFGNIGREVALLAQGFGLRVKIYARAVYKDWIESEGFSFAATPVEAANGADFLSPHTGLGAATGDSFANTGLVDSDVLNAMNDGAVIVNYDRGEVIDTNALDTALSSGKVRYAAIDADLFKNPETGKLSGPMVPYLAVEKNHPGKLELLPHAAADTEHLSRVEGAKQAIAQILDVIRFKSVMNLKGDLPAGYTDAGAVTVNGVGKVTSNTLAAAVADEALTANLRRVSEELAALWGAIDATKDPARRAELLQRYAADLVQAGNTFASLSSANGLKGPFA
ncbi:putative 2-hydroxyacid dehydrogenase [bacterium MnTg03]|nr:putative 2-hydroxyacid dehydrogenase [bacterium MnTg03]